MTKCHMRMSAVSPFFNKQQLNGENEMYDSYLLLAEPFCYVVLVSSASDKTKQKLRNKPDRNKTS